MSDRSSSVLGSDAFDVRQCCGNVVDMTQQLSITLDDQLNAAVRAAAGKNISGWMAQAAQERLARETWQNYNDTATKLGLNDPEWMQQMVADREGSR
jgi:hypothetical protein